MLYIEQPLGVGFDQGKPDIFDEIGLSKEFLGFYSSFESSFNLKDQDIFITGESYGGFYVPYVSDALLTAGYNVKGALIYDPTIGNDDLQFERRYPSQELRSLANPSSSPRSSIRQLLAEVTKLQ